MNMATRVDLRHAWCVFAITFLVYLSTTPGVLEFGDDWSMLQVTRSIVDHGDVDVPANTPGSAATPDGRHYSKYGIGQSLLAVPFYVVGAELADWSGNSAEDAGVLRQGTALTLSATMLGIVATAASVALFFLCIRALGFGRRAAGLSALGLGLGTFVWYWALTFMSEPTSMLALLIAFYAQLRDANRRSAGWLVLAGSGLAVAVLLRPANGIILPGFGLWLLREVWLSAPTLRSAALRIAAWTVPVMGGIAAVAAYNMLRFGSVSELGYGAASYNMRGSAWVGLYGMLFSPGRSMFLYAPILLGSAAGWIPLWQARRRVAIFIVLIVVPYMLLYARVPYWDGGGCWSPRYLATIMPFLMLGLAALMDRGLSRTQWSFLAAVAIASVGVQSLGVAVSCIPYASTMVGNDVSLDRLLWHPAYSPITEHINSVLTGSLPLHVASVLFQSTFLAWMQSAALLAGLLLLVLYLRALASPDAESRILLSTSAAAWRLEARPASTSSDPAADVRPDRIVLKGRGR
jgi:hypothetical protein